MLGELQSRLLKRVERQTLPARFLLSKFYFPDEGLRFNPEYTDPYWSFWYYLGEEVKPKSIVDIGVYFNLEAACCALGAKSERAICICGNTSSPVARQNIRLLKSNMKVAGIREFQMPPGKEGHVDLLIVHGDFLDDFAFIWEGMKLDGLLCVIDNEPGLRQFAKIQNRESVFCNLRHNVGLLRK